MIFIKASWEYMKHLALNQPSVASPATVVSVCILSTKNYIYKCLEVEICGAFILNIQKS